MSSVLDQLRQHRAGTPSQPRSDAEDTRPHVAAYARISDAYEGPETGVTTQGVDRQIDACRHIAEARHWSIEKEYIDNSVSAFKANVTRPAFEELLDDLDTGLIDGVVCYNLDRFARQVSDLERAIRIYDDARKQGRGLFFATAEGDLNLASDDGLTMARVMVAFANKSSRDTARRVTAKHQETRDKGGRVGGGRPFGWDLVVRDGKRQPHALNAVEAAAIRRAASGLVEGSATWRSIAREWNESGLRTPRGGLWQAKTVRTVMRSPRLAGWLVHKEAIAVHSKTGKLIRSQAPAILTDEEYEAVLVAVSGRDKYGNYAATSGRSKYLLTGIVRCAECGAKLTGNTAGPGGRYYYYACHGTRGNGEGMSCGKVASISGRSLDEMVTKLVLPRIIEEAGDVELDNERPHQAELLDLETQKDRLLSAYRERRAPSEAVFPEVMRLDREAERLRHEQAVWLRERRVAARSVGITEETWNDLSVAEKRLHVSRHIEAIYVSRAMRRTGNRFDPARVSMPVWRTTAAPDELADAEGL